MSRRAGLLQVGRRRAADVATNADGTITHLSTPHTCLLAMRQRLRYQADRCLMPLTPELLSQDQAELSKKNMCSASSGSSKASF